MPDKKLRVRYTDAFLYDMDALDSERVVEHIGKVIVQLQRFPDMGSPHPRKMLQQRYGIGIRTVAVDGHLLVYRHSDEILELICLAWGPSVK